jgi:hypothetical protein
MLGGVDLVAGEQAVAMALDVGRPRQTQRRLEAGAAPGLLGQIERETGGGQAQPLQPVRLGAEQIDDPARRIGARGGLEPSPGGVMVHRRHPKLSSRKARSACPGPPAASPLRGSPG